MFEVLRTLKDYAKILLTRQAVNQCYETLQFLKKTYALLVGTSDSFVTAKVDAELSLLFLQTTNTRGIAEYDESDRPLMHAFESEEMYKKLLPEPDNYFKNKA